MKFLTTKEANRLGIPSRIQISGLFLIVGLILTYWSMSLFFMLGSRGRIGALMLGSLLVGIATLLRVGPRLASHFPFLLGATAYFVSLLALSKMQGHAEWYDTRLLIYSFVAFGFFVCGYLLGSERPFFNNASSHWLLVPLAGACVFTQLLFARSMQSVDLITRQTGGRGDFGAAEFNAVGVAFTAGCLAAIFLGLTFINRKLLKRVTFFIAFCFVTLIMLASASRGATLWLVITCGLSLIMIRKQNYFSSKHKMLLLVAVAVGIVITVIFYNFNTAVATRLDVLANRLSGLLSIFDDSLYNQDVSNGRRAIWTFYLSDPSAWLPFGQEHYSDYPHNLWLETIVRYGFLGIPLLCLFLYVFARIVIDALRARVPSDGEFVIIAVLFFFAYMSNMTSLSFSGNRALVLGLGYFLGYYVHLKRQRALAMSASAIPHTHSPGR